MKNARQNQALYRSSLPYPLVSAVTRTADVLCGMSQVSLRYFK